MRIVPKEETLHGTGVCFICESFIDRENNPTLQAIDTNRDFDPPFQHPLVGTKYLCSLCSEDAAHLLGYVTTEEVVEAKTALEEARRLAIPLQERIVSLTDDISKLTHGFVDLPVFDVPDAVTDKAKEKDE